MKWRGWLSPYLLYCAFSASVGGAAEIDTHVAPSLRVTRVDRGTKRLWYVPTAVVATDSRGGNVDGLVPAAKLDKDNSIVSGFLSLRASKNDLTELSNVARRSMLEPFKIDPQRITSFALVLKENDKAVWQRSSAGGNHDRIPVQFSHRRGTKVTCVATVAWMDEIPALNAQLHFKWNQVLKHVAVKFGANPIHEQDLQAIVKTMWSDGSVKVEARDKLLIIEREKLLPMILAHLTHVVLKADDDAASATAEVPSAPASLTLDLGLTYRLRQDVKEIQTEQVVELNERQHITHSLTFSSGLNIKDE